MDVVYDIKEKFNELQLKVMDVTFYASLLKRLAYTMIRIPQSQWGCHSSFQSKLIFWVLLKIELCI